jgi:hypothetical protein
MPSGTYITKDRTLMLHEQTISESTLPAEAWEHALDQAVSTAFEEMLFMAPVYTQEATEFDQSQVHSRIRVQAPQGCTLTLELSTLLVDACIDTLYGGEATSTSRLDIANELTNTIAGLLMSNLTQTSAIQLGLPQGAFGTPAEGVGSVRVARSFVTDSGGLRLTVSQ